MKDFNEKNSKEREKMIEVFIRIYFSMLIGLYLPGIGNVVPEEGLFLYGILSLRHLISPVLSRGQEFLVWKSNFVINCLYLAFYIVI